MFRQKTAGQFTPITFLVIVIAIFICPSLFSQKSVENFPVQFTQFSSGYSNINPASIGYTNNNIATVGYQKPLQGFEGVSTYYFTMHFVPYKIKQGSTRKNVIGIRFYSDKEGAYIKRNRLYGMYAFHTRLSRNVNFSGGIDFGAINYAIKSTPTTGGSSNYNFDANTGVWIYSSGFHAGVSLNQVFKTDIKPIDEITVLPFHMNVTASKTIVKTSAFELRPHLLVTYPYYSKLSIRGCVNAQIMNKVIAEVGLKYNESAFFAFGLKNIELFQNKFELAVSYEMQTQSIAFKLNTIEISMGYYF